MKARLVTGYVPIPGHPRSATEYGELGERLGGVPVPKKAFYMHPKDLWLRKYLDSVSYPYSPSQGDNPSKNSLLYHCVNHQKTTWLAQAANEFPDDEIFVWVDYGIFHQPGITAKAIYEYFEQLDDRKIYAPGCWYTHEFPAIETTHPCWRFCGSVLAVPAHCVHELDFEVRAKARQHIQDTHNVEWEVNTWARVERGQRRLPWHWYKADHDVTQFTNLKIGATP